MCQIAFTLTTTTESGLTIESATGRYKFQNTNNWIQTFSINLGNPTTPNITTNGIYVLQVNVTDSAGNTSDWAESIFTISNNCNGTQCRSYRITNRSRTQGFNLIYNDCQTGNDDEVLELGLGENDTICGFLIDFSSPQFTGMEVVDLGPCG